MQPPIDTQTYYVQSICQPKRLDPARAYDTASCELIQNVAQTLIFWNDARPITFTPGVGYGLQSSDNADLNSYSPVLATALPTIVRDFTGEYYTFTINTAATFQPWTRADGSVVPSRNLNRDDVMYSFRRQMIYDSPYGPSWMWFEPAFGFMGWSTLVRGPFSTDAYGTFTNPADEAAAAALIQSWCYPGPGPNDVTFYFQYPRSNDPTELDHVFAQTWASIIEPEWCQERGGWNGQFAPGWTSLWHWKPTNTRSEIDAWKDPAIYGPVAGSRYPSTNKHVNEIMGTGPYMFTAWDQTNKAWRIDKFTDYWLGWADAGDNAGNYLYTVIWRQVTYWPTTRAMFLDGSFDEIEVGPDRYSELETAPYYPLPEINEVYGINSLRDEAVFFTMDVSAGSPYQSYVGYPTSAGYHLTGAIPNFFADPNIRLAFAYALNYATYIATAYSGEAEQQASWWVDGIGPASYENTALTLRNIDTVAMQNYLNAVVIQGYNVGTYGFETTLVYNTGNEQRRIALQMIADAFSSLGPRYRCNVVGIDCPVFSDLGESHLLPVYCSGWKADFVDPDDFARVYMYSSGYFPIGQGPPFPSDQVIIDPEIQDAAIQNDPTTRSLEYQDLQARYYNDVIGFNLVQPMDRRWTRDWVQGWYCNQLFRGDYFYDLFKQMFALLNIDIVASTITPVTPRYPVVLRCPQSGDLLVGYGSLLPADQAFDITVTRVNYNGAIALVFTVVKLRITSSNGFFYSDSTIVALAPGQTATVTLWWYGTDPGPVYGSRSGVQWTVRAEAWPINGNAQDTSPSDNVVADGTVVIKTLPGDINNNGIVSVLDAQLLSNAFGSNSASPNWNAAADLKADGAVNIFDAILLAGNYNKRVP